MKIDRSFVADMSRSPDAAALIHTLIELGHTLGLVTLAEGIETHEQLEGLRAERCNQGRGSSSPDRSTRVEMADLLEIAEAGKPITLGGPGALRAGRERPRPPRPGAVRPRRVGQRAGNRSALTAGSASVQLRRVVSPRVGGPRRRRARAPGS